MWSHFGITIFKTSIILFITVILRDSHQFNFNGISLGVTPKTQEQSFVQSQVQWGKSYTTMNFYDSVIITFSKHPSSFLVKIGTCFTIKIDGGVISYQVKGMDDFKEKGKKLDKNFNLYSIEIERMNKYYITYKGMSGDACLEQEETFNLPTGKCKESDVVLEPLNSEDFENLSTKRSGIIKSSNLLLAEANQAWGSPVQQKSTLPGGEPEKSVDDSDFTSFKNGSCSSTLADSPNQWFRVDMMRVVPIKEVRILTRSDCCEKWLDNFFITIGNTIEDLWSGKSQQLKCGSIQKNVTNDGTEHVVKCTKGVGGGIQGRYLTIQRDDDKVLSFCDLRVISC